MDEEMASSLISEVTEASNPATTATTMKPPKFSKDDLKEVAGALFLEIKDALLAGLKTEIMALVEAETSKLTAEIMELKQTNESLRDTLKTTAQELDELDQYGRRMCLEVSNIPGDTGDPKEDVEAKFLTLTGMHNVELTAADIDKCHRLGRFRPEFNKSRRIIVKFANSKARQRIYESRRSLGDGIFVQDHLTKLRSQLSYEARQLQRSNHILKTWVSGCKVFVNVMAKGKEIKLLLRSMDDIQSIKAGTIPT